MKTRLTLIAAVAILSIQSYAGQYSSETNQGPKWRDTETETEAPPPRDPIVKDRQYSMQRARTTLEEASPNESIAKADSRPGTAHEARQHSSSIAGRTSNDDAETLR